MKTNIPSICEGEVYQIQPHVKTSRKPIRYICKVDMPDGSTVLVPNCIQSTMFGGIDDYLQFRSRSSNDSGSDTETNAQDEKNSAQTGDRVLIAFIGGNIQKPMIVGYAPHPNQTYEFEDETPADIDPRLVFKYLGMKATIDDEGQLQLIHRGAPKIDYKPRESGLLGAASAALSALTSDGADKPNPAVVPQDADETTLFEFLKGGVFRIRDADGQIIELDRTKKRIYISNNDLKSTESTSAIGNAFATNSTDAEYLMLDKDKQLAIINARKIAQIYSFDKRKDVTEGDHTHKIGGDSEWTISGNDTHKIDGDQQINIEGKQIEDITGNKKGSIKGDWSVECLGDINFIGSGKAFIKMSGGKVTFGGPAAELLDLFDQELDAFINNASSLVLTSVGPGQFNPAALTSLQTIKQLLAQIKG